MRGATESTWRIAVLIEEEGRGGSKYIAENLKVGQFVTLGAPRNHFSFEPNGKISLIGGGVGVTPLIPMLQRAIELGIDWELHYLGRSRSHMAYAVELQEKYPSQVTLHITDEDSRFDLVSHLQQLDDDTDIFACGPEKLLDEIEFLGGDSEQIHDERFAPRQEQFSENVAFLVYAAKSDIQFEVPVDESILVAADFEGIEVEGDCLEGTCGSCETKVISGLVEHRDSILTAKQRRENKCAMICVSRSTGERLVLEL